MSTRASGIRLADHRPKPLGWDEILQALATAAIVRRFVFQSGIVMTGGHELSTVNGLTIRALQLVCAASIRDKAITEADIRRSRLDCGSFDLPVSPMRRLDRSTRLFQK